MTGRQQLPPAARDWLADGPTVLPDRVLDAVLDEIHVTPQRRGLAVISARFAPMRPRSWMAGAVVVVVVAIGVIGAALLLRQPGGVGSTSPGPAASGAIPSVSPSPSVAVSGPTSSAASSLPGGTFGTGVLPAGIYHSTAFKPYVILTLPGGWTRRVDDPELLWFSDGTTDLAFHFMAAEVTAAAAAKAAGASQSTGVDTPAVPVTFGSTSGFSAERPGLTTGNETVFFKPGLNPYDAARGSRIKVWVLDVGGRPVTISLVAPAAAYDAAVAKVTGLLEAASFVP